MMLLISDCSARTSSRFSSAVSACSGELFLVLFETSPQTLFPDTHPAVLTATETMQTPPRRLRSENSGATGASSYRNRQSQVPTASALSDHLWDDLRHHCDVVSVVAVCVSPGAAVLSVLVFIANRFTGFTAPGSATLSSSGFDAKAECCIDHETKLLDSHLRPRLCLVISRKSEGYCRFG